MDTIQICGGSVLIVDDAVAISSDCCCKDCGQLGEFLSVAVSGMSSNGCFTGTFCLGEFFAQIADTTDSNGVFTIGPQSSGVWAGTGGSTSFIQYASDTCSGSEKCSGSASWSISITCAGSCPDSAVLSVAMQLLLPCCGEAAYGFSGSGAYGAAISMVNDSGLFLSNFTVTCT